MDARAVYRAAGSYAQFARSTRKDQENFTLSAALEFLDQVEGDGRELCAWEKCHIAEAIAGTSRGYRQGDARYALKMALEPPHRRSPVVCLLPEADHDVAWFRSVVIGILALPSAA